MMGLSVPVCSAACLARCAQVWPHTGADTAQPACSAWRAALEVCLPADGAARQGSTHRQGAAAGQAPGSCRMRQGRGGQLASCRLAAGPQELCVPCMVPGKATIRLLR